MRKAKTILNSSRRQKETQKSLIVCSEVIERRLKLAAEIFHEDWTPDKLAFWLDTLSAYSEKGIEWAFDTWCRGAKFFPKPFEIVELLETWTEPETKWKPCGNCIEGYVFTHASEKGHSQMQRCDCLIEAIKAKGGEPEPDAHFRNGKPVAWLDPRLAS